VIFDTSLTNKKEVTMSPLSKASQAVSARELAHFRKKLRDQGFPEPGGHYSKMVYVSGAITPTKHCPNMEENRGRIMHASLCLFLLGYFPYCPSVPWFTDPKKYNDRYWMILEMDKKIIADRCDAFYVCKFSRYSNGVMIEHPIAAGKNLPIFYESVKDKKFFTKEHKTTHHTKLHSVS
jgi:hypothetical protein